MVGFEFAIVVAYFANVAVARDEQRFRIERVVVAERVFGSAGEERKLAVWIAFVDIFLARPNPAKVAKTLRLPAGIFLTRRRGERGGRKLTTKITESTERL